MTNEECALFIPVCEIVCGMRRIFLYLSSLKGEKTLRTLKEKKCNVVIKREKIVKRRTKRMKWRERISEGKWVSCLATQIAK